MKEHIGFEVRLGAGAPRSWATDGRLYIIYNMRLKKIVSAFHEGYELQPSPTDWIGRNLSFINERRTTQYWRDVSFFGQLSQSVKFSADA